MTTLAEQIATLESKLAAYESRKLPLGTVDALRIEAQPAESFGHSLLAVARAALVAAESPAAVEAAKRAWHDIGYRDATEAMLAAIRAAHDTAIDGGCGNARESADPPWLADAAEALGKKGAALNWSQVISEIRELVRQRDAFSGEADRYRRECERLANRIETLNREGDALEKERDDLKEERDQWMANANAHQGNAERELKCNQELRLQLDALTRPIDGGGGAAGEDAVRHIAAPAAIGLNVLEYAPAGSVQITQQPRNDIQRELARLKQLAEENNEGAVQEGGRMKLGEKIATLEALEAKFLARLTALEKENSDLRQQLDALKVPLEGVEELGLFGWVAYSRVAFGPDVPLEPRFELERADTACAQAIASRVIGALRAAYSKVMWDEHYTNSHQDAALEDFDAAVASLKIEPAKVEHEQDGRAQLIKSAQLNARSVVKVGQVWKFGPTGGHSCVVSIGDGYAELENAGTIRLTTGGRPDSERWILVSDEPAKVEQSPPVDTRPVVKVGQVWQYNGNDIVSVADIRDWKAFDASGKTAFGIADDGRPMARGWRLASDTPTPKREPFELCKDHIATPNEIALRDKVREIEYRLEKVETAK